jgi:hypothetical protein
MQLLVASAAAASGNLQGAILEGAGCGPWAIFDIARLIMRSAESLSLLSEHQVEMTASNVQGESRLRRRVRRPHPRQRARETTMTWRRRLRRKRLARTVDVAT